MTYLCSFQATSIRWKCTQHSRARLIRSLFEHICWAHQNNNNSIMNDLFTFSRLLCSLGTMQAYTYEFSCQRSWLMVKSTTIEENTLLTGISLLKLVAIVFAASGVNDFYGTHDHIFSRARRPLHNLVKLWKFSSLQPRTGRPRFSRYDETRWYKLVSVSSYSAW